MNQRRINTCYLLGAGAVLMLLALPTSALAQRLRNAVRASQPAVCLLYTSPSPRD